MRMFYADNNNIYIFIRSSSHSTEKYRERERLNKQQT